MGTNESKSESTEKEVPVNSERLEFLRDPYAERHANILILIQLMLNLASDLDEQQWQLNIAQTAIASTRVAGGIVLVVSFGLSFVTFGASLIVGIVGGAIMIASDTGSQVVNVVAMKKLDIINEKLEKQHQRETRICKVIQESAKNQQSIASTIVGVANDGAKLADVVGDVGVPLVNTLTTCGKVAHFGRFAFTVGGMAVDIYIHQNP